MYPEKKTPYWTYSLIFLAMLLVAAFGCPSDPSDLTLDDAGSPSDDGGLPDAGVDADVVDPEPDAEPDIGADAEVDVDTGPPPPPCDVPSSFETLSEALDAEHCSTIELDDDLGIDELGLEGGLLILEESVTIEGENHEITVPAAGLFHSGDADVDLVLNNLDFAAADDEDSAQAPVISLDNNASLTASNLTFDDFDDLERAFIVAMDVAEVVLSDSSISRNLEVAGSLLVIDGADLVHIESTQFDDNTAIGDGADPFPALIDISNTNLVQLEDTTIDDNEMTGRGTLGLSCSDSTVEVLANSRISGNDIEFKADGTSNGEFEGNFISTIVSLDDCPFSVDGSDISHNTMSSELHGHDAAAVYCESTDEALVWVGNGARIDANIVDLEIDVAVRNLRFGAAGLDLNGCALDIDDAEINDNQLLVEIKDFSSGIEDEFNIELRGGGIYVSDADADLRDATIGANRIDLNARSKEDYFEVNTTTFGGGIGVQTGELIVEDSAVIGNQIQVDLSDLIHQDSSGLIYGGGIAVDAESDTESLIKRSEIDGNILEYEDSNGQVRPDIRGAGVAFTSASDKNAVLILDKSTISNNRIKAADEATGAGVAFTGFNDAQFQMVNSTISSNSIEDSDEGKGAGLYLNGPDDTDAGDSIVNQETLEDIWESSPLSAIIRYSTIALNNIDGGGGAGAGLYIDNRATETSTQGRTVFASIVGLMLHQNERGGDVYDCEGSARFADIENNTVYSNGNGSDSEWGSGHNLISYFEGGSIQTDCFTMLMNSAEDTITDMSESDFSIGDLGTYFDSPTRVHPPQDSDSDPVGAGQPGGDCSDIINGDSLDLDQTGEQDVRPINSGDNCDIGAVEWRAD